jgi:hypothetical protein
VNTIDILKTTFREQQTDNVSGPIGPNDDASARAEWAETTLVTPTRASTASRERGRACGETSTANSRNFEKTNVTFNQDVPSIALHDEAFSEKISNL